MICHRIWADVQLLAGLAIALAQSDQSQHLHLALAQASWAAHRVDYTHVQFLFALNRNRRCDRPTTVQIRI